MGGPGGAGARWNEPRRLCGRSWDGWAWAGQNRSGARWDGWRRMDLNRADCSLREECSTGMGWGVARWDDPDP